MQTTHMCTCIFPMPNKNDYIYIYIHIYPSFHFLLCKSHATLGSRLLIRERQTLKPNIIIYVKVDKKI